MLPTTVPCQVPEVIVPTVAISVPTNLDAAIEPASIALVTTPACIVVAKLPVPEPVTLPVRIMVWSPVLVPLKLLPAILPLATILLGVIAPSARVILHVPAVIGDVPVIPFAETILTVVTSPDPIASIMALTSVPFIRRSPGNT